MSLSRQSIALVVTTKNKETKHYIHWKHKRETETTASANKANYTLVRYAFYRKQSGTLKTNLFLQPTQSRYRHSESTGNT